MLILNHQVSPSQNPALGDHFIAFGGSGFSQLQAAIFQLEEAHAKNVT